MTNFKLLVIYHVVANNAFNLWNVLVVLKLVIIFIEKNCLKISYNFLYKNILSQKISCYNSDKLEFVVRCCKL